MAATAIVTPTLPVVSADPTPVILAPVPQVAPVPQPAKQSRVDPNNMTTFIHRLQKMIHPNLSVSADVIDSVNYLLLDALKRVVKSADAAAAYGQIITMRAGEIQAGVRSTLPDALLEGALKTATESCNNYDPKILDPPKRGTPKAAPAVSGPVDAADHTSSPKKSGAYRSERAGLTLPIPRIETVIRELVKAKAIQVSQVGEGAPVYLTSVLEFIARRLLSAAGEFTLTTKIHLIKTEHLVAGMEKDAGLRELFALWLLTNKSVTVKNEVATPQSPPQSPAPQSRNPSGN